MESTSTKKPFNTRSFVSLALFVSGTLLPVSGIMNHELQFDPLSEARHFWMSVHNMSALLFSLAAITHILIHRRVLLCYARNARSIVISREALSAAVLVLGLVGLFASHAFVAGR